MEQIKKIYYNLDSLIDIYNDLPETEVAFNAMNDYVESLGIFESEEMKHNKRKLYNLISTIGVENERQGFTYGFKYAFSLILEAVGGI